ncbi:MAG: XRE family transcriptional regulator [Caldiserica bacterium]|nr:MAG: XRE family transcriptional regulator [Caldisericota bacterium]
MDIYKILGKRIREERKRLNLTQEELAERVGISPKFLSDIERNRKKASLQTFFKLSQILKLNIENISAKTEKKKYSSKFSWILDNLSQEECEILLKIIKLIQKYKKI